MIQLRNNRLTGMALPAIRWLGVVMLALLISTGVHAQQPTSVTLGGSFQSELGCPGDWQPDCASTHLVYDANDDVWQAVFTIPAGTWEYKAALNDSWDENYGVNASRDGANIAFNLAATRGVKFYYNHSTHWITDNVNSRIVTAPGSYQSEIGCGGDWDPSCLRSWLQDPDGDNTFTFSTNGIPVGNYEVKAAVNESWDENYGQGGVPGGDNILFTVTQSNSDVLFSFNGTTNVLTVAVTTPLTPTEAIDDLISQVDALRTTGTLNKGQAKALSNKLEEARKLLIKGNNTAALNQLTAFINQVNTFIADQVLTNAQGQALIDSATAIVNLINSSTGASASPGMIHASTTTSAVPEVVALGQNYPNPFNPVTTIEYALPVDARVSLEVFDVLGERVVELVNGQVAAGYHAAAFDASNLASGMYFYRLNADDGSGKTFTQLRKLVLMK